jgi:predicted HicB family RNase H-like nuclease
MILWHQDIKEVNNIKQLTIRLDDELHKQLKYLSVDIDKSLNEYISELIKQDMEKRKAETKK